VLRLRRLLADSVLVDGLTLGSARLLRPRRQLPLVVKFLA
jgi:hypothetical protein